MTRGKLILVVVVAVGVLALFSTWSWFHSIPTQAELRGWLAAADMVEIFRMEGEKPKRWIRLTNPEEWKDLTGELEFEAHYWQFSEPPTETVVIQAIQGKERLGAFEVRGDGHIHIRKAVRWYKMPVKPGFEAKAREILAERGQDLKDEPPQDAEGPTGALPKQTSTLSKIEIERLAIKEVSNKYSIPVENLVADAMKHEGEWLVTVNPPPPIAEGNFFAVKISADGTVEYCTAGN